ncbi:hypothetical protein ACQCSV_16675 [Pseudarthrobacter sp. S3]|uniref:hypothetical protein n=1 Tax=Pseudarthrobacter sp. S3 TaxID=3418419 RepID=UPI003CEC3E97
MHITVISSLDALCRQQACQDAAAANPGAVVVLHDLLENGVVIRRIFSQSRLLVSTQTQLEHGCLSCAVRLDLAPTILLAGVDLFPADPALRVRGVQLVRERPLPPERFRHALASLAEGCC